MPKLMPWKKIMTGALAFTLITGGSVPVLLSNPTSVSAAATGITPFSDVPAGFWAEKHIYRLSLQQIVKGYENKKDGTFTFQYNNSISQEEAVIMAIRFAGFESLLDRSSIIVFDEAFIVKQDYKPYIELAFQKGLLDREFEYQLARNDAKQEWGKKPASREWVTKLIIKTIGQTEKANQLANTKSTFSDAGQINGTYLGYVNAAVELGLVNGVTATTFAPASPVNRASLTTILSRAQKDFPVTAPNQHYGIITELTDNTLTIFEEGKEAKYSFDASTGLYFVGNDQIITKDKLILYGEVSLIAENGKAKFIEMLGNEQHVEEITAPLGIVNETEKVMYIYIDKTPKAIPYNDQVKIVDTKGKALTVKDLSANDIVTVVRDTFRENSLPIRIVVERVSNTTSIEGTIYLVDNKVITIQTSKGPVSKYLAAKHTVNINNSSNAKVSDLIIGADDVKVALNDKDEVTDITVVKRNVKVMYSPEITDFDSSKKRLTVMNKEGTRAEALFITDRTRFLMDGIAVKQDDINKLIYNWTNIVVQYADGGDRSVIISMNLVTQYKGTLTELDKTNKEVTFSLSDGISITLDYSDATVVSLTKNNVSINELKVGTKLTFELAPNQPKIINFLLHETADMTVDYVNKDTKEVRFKLGSNVYSTLFDEISVLDKDGKTVEFSAIKLTQKVKALFEGTTISTVTLQ